MTTKDCDLDDSLLIITIIIIIIEKTIEPNKFIYIFAWVLSFQLFGYRQLRTEIAFAKRQTGDKNVTKENAFSYVFVSD